MLNTTIPVILSKSTTIISNAPRDVAETTQEPLGASSTVFMVFALIFVFISFVLFSIWLWMLMDCINHESSKDQDKLIWLLIIFLLGPIGALLYLFIRRPARIRAKAKAKSKSSGKRAVQHA